MKVLDIICPECGRLYNQLHKEECTQNHVDVTTGASKWKPGVEEESPFIKEQFINPEEYKRMFKDPKPPENNIDGFIDSNIIAIVLLSDYINNIKTRFWKKIQLPKNPNDCWEWVAAKNRKGYGEPGAVFGQRMLAHRLSYLLHIGEIPEGMHVLHKCDNPSCVNPNHLFLGTNADNVKDKCLKGRQSTNIGDTNPNSKLTLNQVLYILNNPQISNKNLAIEFGVSVVLIQRIRRRELWKHITIH